MRKKRGAEHLLLDLWACFLIPAYTLLFAGSIEWFGTNFSVLAVTGADHYRGFLVWGLLAGMYFLVLLLRLARTIPARGLRRMLYGLTLGACGCLALGLPLPYVPEVLPQIAQLHILMVFSACVLLMAALLLVVLRGRREDRTAYQPFFRGWWGIVACCGALFLLAGIISTALEVFFTISTTLFTRRLWLLRKQ